MLDAKRLACSCCSTPRVTLAQVLAAAAAAGYRKFEGFTEWAASRFDLAAGPAEYLELARSHGLTFCSMHLPAIGEDLRAGLDRAVAAAHFAKAIGAKVVLFKAKSRALYLSAAREFLDRTGHLGLTPVLQNHVGTPITTLDDFRAVIDGIGDPRLKTLLEVGMFHSIGVPWQKGYELLGESIALVHIKDQIGEKRVPFGEGEVDLEGLFRRLNADGYAGDIVIEMEVCQDDFARSVELLAAARRHCLELFAKIAKEKQP